MKAIYFVTTIVILFTAGAISEEVSALHLTGSDSTVVTQQATTDVLFNRFEAGLISGLDSEVKGVVEASIYNALNFKIAYPEFNSETVTEKLYSVALEGATHSLRYRAFLALAYYRNPGEFDAPEQLLSILDYRHQNGIFFYLQDKIQNEQFTSTYY
ncbi:MAG: hypothetical protein EA360_04850 [Balneolaceae bacterium]|nr:MAG: hypothetical protein EA360_04850 [Balneolaceae bacterium]